MPYRQFEQELQEHDILPVVGQQHPLAPRSLPPNHLSAVVDAISVGQLDLLPVKKKIVQKRQKFRKKNTKLYIVQN